MHFSFFLKIKECFLCVKFSIYSIKRTFPSGGILKFHPVFLEYVCCVCFNNNHYENSSFNKMDNYNYFVQEHAPCVKPTLVCTDSDELKEFISRPALKYILRFLTGLAAEHEPTQVCILTTNKLNLPRYLLLLL